MAVFRELYKIWPYGFLAGNDIDFPLQMDWLSHQYLSSNLVCKEDQRVMVLSMLITGGAISVMFYLSLMSNTTYDILPLFGVQFNTMTFSNVHRLIVNMFNVADIFLPRLIIHVILIMILSSKTIIPLFNGRNVM